MRPDLSSTKSFKIILKIFSVVHFDDANIDNSSIAASSFSFEYVQPIVQRTPQESFVEMFIRQKVYSLKNVFVEKLIGAFVEMVIRQ